MNWTVIFPNTDTGETLCALHGREGVLKQVADILDDMPGVVITIVPPMLGGAHLNGEPLCGHVGAATLQAENDRLRAALLAVYIKIERMEAICAASAAVTCVESVPSNGVVKTGG